MGFQHRKLMSAPINETSSYDCTVCYQFCVSECSDYCPGFCIPNSPPYIDGYPPPVPISGSPSHPNPTNKFLIVTSTIIAATFLVLCCLVYYIKCFRRRDRSRSSGAETDETRDEFLDQDHGLIVDHPIWYINTIGLQPSIIHSIAVCKYKKGEGLVEGTDCSVCLNEFQEDETLRLLPKCNHAFHIPCIDTWLRSHTNCPMCRAPIVSDSGNRGPPSSTSSSSSSVNNEGPGRSEETQVVIMEEDGNGEEAERGTNGGVSEIRNEEDELGVENSEDEILQPMRRSASLDSMEACQIRNDIVNGNKTEAPSNSNSNTESSTGKEQSVKIVSRRAAAGNQSLLRSLQSNPIFMRRSASFSGKFSLSISNNSSSNSNNNNNNKSHGTNPTLRSF